MYGKRLLFIIIIIIIITTKILKINVGALTGTLLLIYATYN